MKTFALSALLLGSALAVGCTDDAASGEDVWTFELQLLAQSDPSIPACANVEDGFELHALHDDVGDLRGVYSPGPDPRFDIYRVTTEYDHSIVLEATKHFPGDATESWEIDIKGLPQHEHDLYDGTATQTFVTSGVTCRNSYLVRMESSTAR